MWLVSVVVTGAKIREVIHWKHGDWSRLRQPCSGRFRSQETEDTLSNVDKNKVERLLCDVYAVSMVLHDKIPLLRSP
jgi:hypothetical protein